MAPPGFIPPHLRKARIVEPSARAVAAVKPAAAAAVATLQTSPLGDDYETQNASAWNNSSEQAHAVNAASPASLQPHPVTPSLSLSLSRSSSSSSSGEVDLIEMSRAGSPKAPRWQGRGQHRHRQSDYSNTTSLLDDPVNEPAHQEWFASDPEDSISSPEPTPTELEDFNDDFSDDGHFSSGEESLPTSGATFLSGDQRILKVETSIPDIDVRFDPAAPAYGIIIKQGPNSLYFASHFNDCKFDGLVIFDNCVISETVFMGCTFKGTCIFTNVVFKDVQAIQCVFDDSWHTNRTFQAGEHIGEENIGDRAIVHSRELPLAMRDSTWQDGQTWIPPVADTTPAASASQAPTPTSPPVTAPASTPASAPASAPAPAPATPTNVLASTRYLSLKARNSVPSNNSSGLVISVIPADADVKFDRRPSHGFTMELSDGGLCVGAQFKDCHFNGITFINCVLFNVAFKGCTFKNVTFTNCVLIDTHIVNCVMKGNAFTDQKYEGAELERLSYDVGEHQRGYRTPEEIKNKFWLPARLATQRDERLRTPAEVLEMYKDEVEKNPGLFKPTVFGRKTFD